MYSLLLLNGGVGSRIAANKPKQLLKIKGIPILVYSLVAVDKIPEITEIILNYPHGWREEVENIVESFAIQTPVIYVEAGETRQASVAKMVELATNDDVIIHESARPLVSKQDFVRLIEAEGNNASLMLEIPFTVAPVDPISHTVTGFLNRENLRNVQLPQKFSKSELADAHQKAKTRGVQFTEDATLVADAGYTVKFINGTDQNIKVTTPTDVKLASYLFAGDEEE